MSPELHKKYQAALDALDTFINALELDRSRGLVSEELEVAMSTVLNQRLLRLLRQQGTNGSRSIV